MNAFMNFTAPSSSSPAPMGMNNGLNGNGMSNNGVGGMGTMGMQRGSSGNIHAMGQMNSNNMRQQHQQQQQQQQNKSRNTMGGLDPFGNFN